MLSIFLTLSNFKTLAHNNELRSVAHFKKLKRAKGISLYKGKRQKLPLEVYVVYHKQSHIAVLAGIDQRLIDKKV